MLLWIGLFIWITDLVEPGCVKNTEPPSFKIWFSPTVQIKLLFWDLGFFWLTFGSWVWPWNLDIHIFLIIVILPWMLLAVSLCRIISYCILHSNCNCQSLFYSYQNWYLRTDNTVMTLQASDLHPLSSRIHNANAIFNSHNKSQKTGHKMLADEDKGTLLENGEEVTPGALGIEDNVTRVAQLSLLSDLTPQHRRWI